LRQQLRPPWPQLLEPPSPNSYKESNGGRLPDGLKFNLFGLGPTGPNPTCKRVLRRGLPRRRGITMPALKVRRIDLSANNASQQLAKLRDQFKLDGEVITPQSKKLTQSVFGKPLSPAVAVERICNDV